MFREFDKNNNQCLSKFEFVNSINYLSRKVGGLICCRADLDSLFQIIDINGDQVISRKEYYILIRKFIKVLANESSSSAFDRAIKFANSD